MKILFLGDVVGKNGREALKKYLPKLRADYAPDFVIVNGENASHGKGLTYNHYIELSNLGVDAITLGNHYNSKKEIYKYIDNATKLVRPLNVKDEYLGGSGSVVFTKNGVDIRVTNLLGEAFMNMNVGVDDPYSRIILETLDKNPCIHIVDFHAESTSEKQILGYLLDGKVSAVIGTHTHVQTNDARILEKGTAFMADAGMCGAANGVIGFEKQSVIDKIVFGKSSLFNISEEDLSIISGVSLDIDEKTFMCKEITPILIKERIK